VPTAARRPTIADVARRAGVSKGAVSLALNDRPGLSDATRLRIRAVAEELGWRPSARARALSEARALAVGIVLPHPPSGPYFGRLVAGMEAELAASGYALVLSVPEGASEEEAAYRRLADEGRIDGVLLTDSRFDDPRYELVRGLGLDAVVVGRPGPACPFPGVASDERTTIARAVGHLAELGHTRIAHVAGPAALVHAAERRDAWRDALLAARLPAGRAVAGGFTGSGGAKATRTLLRARDRPTAIVYASDVMAIGGLGVARELGLRVPEDVSIVGFDDIPLAALVTPPLTTIRQDPVAAGRAATRLLLARLRDGPVEVPTLPPPALVVRASTGPAARAPRARRSR
jgi:DNA-binding LacI/PurR family transcriptional regulator